MAARFARRPACGACRGGLQPGGLRPGPTEAAAETSPSAPAKKPAKTLGFRRFSFCMCCMVMWFTLVQTLAFSIRFYPFSTVLIPSSTQNAPSFAFFGLFRMRFSLFCWFTGAKFSGWFLCILLHSAHKLKPSVITCRREVSFFTLFSSLSVLLLIPLLQKTCYNFFDFYPRQPQEDTVYAFCSMWKPRG